MEVWTRRLEASQPAQESEDGFTVRRLGWASGAALLRLRRAEKLHFSWTLFCRLISERKSYDVVIVQQALYPAIVTALACSLVGKPLVVRVASTGVTSDFRTWGKLSGVVQWLLRTRARALVVLNEQGASEAIEVGFSPTRIHRIPNGVEAGPAPASRSSAAGPRIAYVGGFRSEKRVDMLLQAWSMAGAPGELLLAGGGGLQASLETSARDLGVAPTFLGEVAEPQHLLRTVDIFVLASDAEGMSNALLEAMAEGCACLATFVGGNVDCLAPGSEAPPPGGVIKGPGGWLVNRGDVSALAMALKELCGDAEIREELGRLARKRVLSEYSITRTAAAYVTLFQEVYGASPA